MVPKYVWRTMSPLLLGLLAVLVLWLGLDHAGAEKSSSQDGIGSTLGRPDDPIIVPGAEMPALIGWPIGELVLYSFEADSWSPVPFQIDERTNDITGTY